MNPFAEIEASVFVDPGNRGIGEMWQRGSLARAATEILKCDRNRPSYILTGFCCMGDQTETDGPLGSVILCRMLRAIGFNSHLLTDRWAANVVLGVAGDCPVLVTNDPSSVHDPSFIVSVERPARSAKSGKFSTMKARDISPVTAPLDELFPRVGDRVAYLTIGIGDGGNEVGTGNVADLVRRDVPHGDEICVARGCDILIMSGVSNWGALALAAALAISTRNPEHRQTYIKLSEQQHEILVEMNKHGAYDGCTGKCEPSVDGMAWENEHASVATALKEIVEKCQETKLDM